MNDQAEEHGITFVAGDKLVRVSFLSKMEVRTDGVLKKVNDQVSAQDQQGGTIAPEPQALRHNFYQGGCQHESRPERDEIFEV